MFSLFKRIRILQKYFYSKVEKKMWVLQFDSSHNIHLFYFISNFIGYSFKLRYHKAQVSIKWSIWQYVIQEIRNEMQVLNYLNLILSSGIYLKDKMCIVTIPRSSEVSRSFTFIITIFAFSCSLHRLLSLRLPSIFVTRVFFAYAILLHYYGYI